MKTCKTIRAFFQYKYFWLVAIIVLVLIMLVTIYKDLYFTGNEPNPAFYFTVPVVNLAGSALIVFIAARLSRHTVPFGIILKVFLVSEIVMQVWENIAKAIYYAVWRYPGALWFVSIPLSLCLVSYLCVCALRVSWKAGILFSVAGTMFGMIMVMIFMALTGIETPGS